MIKEAEAHAAEDKARRELTEAHNHLDSLVYNTEKTVRENQAKLSAETKKSIESALENAHKALDSDNKSVIESAMTELTSASHALAEELYRSGTQAGSTHTTGKGSDDDVVDADFNEVDEDKK
jgi:molecular chaperone DnaK